jgi:hypothetical protein
MAGSDSVPRSSAGACSMLNPPFTPAQLRWMAARLDYAASILALPAHPAAPFGELPKDRRAKMSANLKAAAVELNDMAERATARNPDSTHPKQGRVR